MKQVYRIKFNLSNRPQICGKGKMLSVLSIEEAQAKLEAAAENLVRHARWASYMSPINQLRKPLLELRLARRRQAGAIVKVRGE